jgi:GDPmannose 4,6-dehydratase
LAVCVILLIHESLRRGLTFVAKNTRDLANIDALSDWGHAIDFVRMQGLMLQQTQAEDFVIVTGVQYKVRQFIEKIARALGMPMRLEGAGVNDVGYWNEQAVIKIDSRHFRPFEVETLLATRLKSSKSSAGYPNHAGRDDCRNCWIRLADANKHALLKKNGYEVSASVE